MCTAPAIVGSVFETGTAITAAQTYILAGYTVQCEGIVTTWEFCYQKLNASSVTFYPGIWEITGTSGGSTTYSLIQSNTVTFDPRGSGSFSCQTYILPVTEQFAAPLGSVVGLYNPAVMQTLLLHTSNDSQITTYQVANNQSSVVAGQDVNYNIAIRVYLGEFMVFFCSVCHRIICHQYRNALAIVWCKNYIREVYLKHC